MGATRRKRQGRPHAIAAMRLHALSLAVPSATENSAPGAVFSAIVGATAGSTLTLVEDAGGRFALSGGAIVAGAVALDRETTASHAITLRETLAGYANSPRDTVLTITVLNLFEAPDLGALSLSSTEFVAGVAAAGAILGATPGSTISAIGIPAGLAIDGASRTWAWDGSGAVSAGSLSLTESHPDAGNSPRVSVIGWDIVEAPSVAISGEFPILKAAYEAGQRALISWIGDSTVANAGGMSEETSSACYLREYLAAQGLAGVIGGCFSAGDKGFIGVGVRTIAQYAQFYEPDAAIDASFTSYGLFWNATLGVGSAGKTAFGLMHLSSTTAGDKVRYDPGFAYDRVELFYPTFDAFGGAGTFDLKIGSTVVAHINQNQPSAYRKTATYSITRSSMPIDQVVTGGTVWPGAVRVWDSTASRILQVENLGVCSARCDDWLGTSGVLGGTTGMASTLAILGAHLVIIQLGVNEQNDGVSAGDYQANLTALIDLCKTAGADVLVCLPPPAAGGWAMDTDHRAAVPAACAAAGIGAPVNLYSGIGFDQPTDAPDGVHPDASGNYKIVNGIGGLGGVGARILGVV